MLLLFFHLHSGIIGFHYPFPLPCKLFRNKDHHLTLGLINYRHKQHMSSQPYLRIVCRLGQILPVTSDKQSESQEGSGGLAWRTGAYQATLPLPFWTGQVRENKMENNSYVKIRHFTKAKVCAHISKDKKTPYSLLPMSKQCSATSQEAGLQHMLQLLWKANTVNNQCSPFFLL